MPIEGIRDHPLTNIIRNAARGDLFGDSRPLVGWLIHGAAGFVTPAVACWLHLALLWQIYSRRLRRIRLQWGHR
jgi:hypothetical protein